MAQEIPEPGPHAAAATLTVVKPVTIATPAEPPASHSGFAVLETAPRSRPCGRLRRPSPTWWSWRWQSPFPRRRRDRGAPAPSAEEPVRAEAGGKDKTQTETRGAGTRAPSLVAAMVMDQGALTRTRRAGAPGAMKLIGEACRRAHDRRDGACLHGLGPNLSDRALAPSASHHALGELRCEGRGAIVITIDGTDYAVNGMAGSLAIRRSNASGTKTLIPKSTSIG